MAICIASTQWIEMEDAMEPIQIGTIDYSAAGDNCKLLVGDINGDGRMEVILMQPNGGIDDRYEPHQITCVTAFDLNGNLLWQKGKPVEEPGKFGSDFPAQVYDIDGDGNLEVLCIMDKTYFIIDGRTGNVKKQFPLPSDMAHDCIIIANLTGHEIAREVILKDRYEHLWAMDENFNVLWSHKGNVGHFPWTYDVNGDGYDEIMAGYDLLDCKGNVLWSCKDLEDHADCLWVGDVNGDGALEIAVGGSVTCLYDINGNELWRYDGSVESQHIALGKFCEDQPGLQMAGLDRIIRGDGYKGQWDGKDGMFMLDCDGKEVWKETRKTKGWLTIVNTLRNWNGEEKDYILAYRRGGGELPKLYNGKMEAVVTFPYDGYVISADLFGRDMEDVIIYSGTTAHIYSGSTYDLKKTPAGKSLPQPKRLFATTLYPGGSYVRTT